MADLADVAERVIANNLEASLQNRKNYELISAFECEECGNKIPEQRRKLGGVTLCIDCQSVLEAKQKHHRGYL